MNIGLYHAASALNATERWQELISENLASGSVPGYRSREMSFSAVQAGVLSPTAAAQAQGPRAYSMPDGTPAISFATGEMRYTGVATDLAVEGSGFFEIQLPNGTIAYTRDGEFHVNAQGQLVTKQGFLVLGDGGPVQLDLDNPAPITIAPSGEISQGADIGGRLRIVEFENEQALQPVSGSCFVASGTPAGPRAAVNSTVRQGWLEGSNTSVVGQMANLITAMRTFEANQRVVQLHDERMSRAISELGTPA